MASVKILAFFAVVAICAVSVQSTDPLSDAGIANALRKVAKDVFSLAKKVDWNQAVNAAGNAINSYMARPEFEEVVGLAKKALKAAGEEVLKEAPGLLKNLFKH